MNVCPHRARIMELVKIKRTIISANVLVAGKEEIVRSVSGRDNDDGDDGCDNYGGEGWIRL